MWAIVGLGNPGLKYSRTRHNVGFMVVDELSARMGVEFREKATYLVARTPEAVLVKPATFMNKSGIAVRDCLKRFSVEPSGLLIICDDLDMETGKIRIRRTGSAGGHNGVESVIQTLGTKDFIRVKIGIGRDPFLPPEEYVLRKFVREEIPVIKETVVAAADAVLEIIKSGVERAMNDFNRARPKQAEP